jgi:radical SAM superfamily enzyme YgiQ (UPF0313 family)
MRILLVSTYEMGHQPLGLAAPAAALRAAGRDVECLDLAVASPTPGSLESAELVAVSVPMHTAGRLGVAFARRLRKLNPRATIAFYGLYAAPLYDELVGSSIADAVIGGEYEPGLVALADRLSSATASAKPLPGVGPLPRFGRQRFLVPDRTGLPGLDHYARLDTGDELRLAGYVEASRGCAHTCAHCPITPVYGGRLRLVQPEVVLADIEQLVDFGAEHITFGDPDFFNAVPHSFAIAAETHRRHPHLTFDVTIKVEHLIEHSPLLAKLRKLGCLFLTSAFESTDDLVLAALEKGHTGGDLDRVVADSSRHGIVIRPTWVAFTPWTTLRSFVDLLEFVEGNGLVSNVQPVQYGLRLLLPPGSPLVATINEQGRLGAFEPERLSFSWTNPDPRVDALQAEIAAIVESAASTDDGAGRPSPVVAFARVKRAALAALTGRDSEVAVDVQHRAHVPGLTEAWFC